MKVVFTVEGKPIPKGSMRTYLAKRKATVANPEGSVFPQTVHNNQEGIAYFTAQVQQAWTTAVEVVFGDVKAEPKGTPMYLTATFAFPRPASHFLPVNSKRTEPELRPDAPLYMTKTPDADKLVRTVADALTGLAYEDDKQIVSWDIRKRYANRHYAYIEVGRYDDGDD